MFYFIVDTVQNNEGEESVIDLFLVGFDERLAVALLELLVVLVLHELGSREGWRGGVMVWWRGVMLVCYGVVERGDAGVLWCGREW